MVAGVEDYKGMMADIGHRMSEMQYQGELSSWIIERNEVVSPFRWWRMVKRQGEERAHVLQLREVGPRIPVLPCREVGTGPLEADIVSVL